VSTALAKTVSGVGEPSLLLMMEVQFNTEYWIPEFIATK